jgi:hypothetical protein
VLSAVANLLILRGYLRTQENFCGDVETDTPPDLALAGEGEWLLRLLRHDVQSNSVRSYVAK